MKCMGEIKRIFQETSKDLQPHAFSVQLIGT